MSTRLIVVVPTIVAACTVATSLNTTSAGAVDECLAAPNATAPAGRHWYYRSDRAGNRCWYQAEKVEKTKKARQGALPVPSQKPAAAPPVETPAVAAVVEVPQPVAAPDDIVTIFSQNWPNPIKPVDTVGRASTAVSGTETAVSGTETAVSTNNAEEAEPQKAPTQEVPLVRPVVSVEESAAVETSHVWFVKTDRKLVLIAGSLCLACLAGLAGAFVAVRFRRRHALAWNPGPAPWHSSDGLDGQPVRDTGSDLRRDTREPAPDALQELEATLQDLFATRRQRAA